MNRTRNKFMINYILGTAILLEHTKVDMKIPLEKNIGSKCIKNKKSKYNIEVKYNGKRLSDSEVDNILGKENIEL